MKHFSVWGTVRSWSCFLLFTFLYHFIIHCRNKSIWFILLHLKTRPCNTQALAHGRMIISIQLKQRSFCFFQICSLPADIRSHDAWNLEKMNLSGGKKNRSPPAARVRVIRNSLQRGLSVASLCTCVRWINGDSPSGSLALSCALALRPGRSGQIKAALSVRKWIISR